MNDNIILEGILDGDALLYSVEKRNDVFYSKELIDKLIEIGFYKIEESNDP